MCEFLFLFSGDIGVFHLLAFQRRQTVLGTRFFFIPRRNHQKAFRRKTILSRQKAPFAPYGFLSVSLLCQNTFRLYMKL
jgi:hypothetical protein